MTTHDTAAQMERFYVGWLLDHADREILLARCPPRYTDIVAHHVTLKFGDRTATPPAATTGFVVGEANDGVGVQALVIAIGGTTDRPDGSTYHITWSLEPGRNAKESNDVISTCGWIALERPVPIHLAPQNAGS